MDKQKVKIILIAIACLLAIFLLYRTFSRISDNKTSAAGKIDAANADLTIKQNQDAYIAERELQKKTDEETKVGYISEAQKADGVASLDNYLATLNDNQKKLYKLLRTEYIRVMGVDPGLMSLDDISKWYKDYMAWSELNDQYIRLTGETKSFLDPDFDTVEEMKAATLSAEAQVHEAWEQAWIDEYELFCHDRNGYKGCTYISLGSLRKWFDSPAQLLPFQEYLTQKYNSFLNRYEKVSVATKRLFDYFSDDDYIHNLNGNGELTHVRGCNDISDALYQELASFNLNDYSLMTKLLRDAGGVAIYTAVNSNNSVDKSSKTRVYNWYDAALCVASFYYSYQNSTNIFGAIASLGVSAAVQKNNKVKNYVPTKLNALLNAIEVGGRQTYTPFGYTAEMLDDTVVAAYSQNLYGFSDAVYESISNNRTSLESFLGSEEYEKGIINYVRNR